MPFNNKEVNDVIDISFTIQYCNDTLNNTPRDLIFLGFALSTSNILLLNSKLPSFGNVRIAVKSILHHQALSVSQILNDTVPYRYLVLY